MTFEVLEQFIFGGGDQNLFVSLKKPSQLSPSSKFFKLVCWSVVFILLLAFVEAKYGKKKTLVLQTLQGSLWFIFLQKRA